MKIFVKSASLEQIIKQLPNDYFKAININYSTACTLSNKTTTIVEPYKPAIHVKNSVPLFEVLNMG